MHLHLPLLLSLPLLLLLTPLATGASTETVLGLYIFSRHGDRTTKAYPPSTLTDLGYSQIFSSGGYFRTAYISSNSSSNSTTSNTNTSSVIHGISPNIAKLSQLSASAPLDSVLMPSAQGFLQGLYPPVGNALGEQTLANGTVVKAPLDGYQLIPVSTAGTGTGGGSVEDSVWLQGSSGCAKAEISSNGYYTSGEYEALENSTRGFYAGLLPVVNTTFNASQASFKNAYSIFDYLNVATIHNATNTIPSSALLTPPTLLQLRTLADAHEFSLAYNASDPIRAIAGATLAAQVLNALDAIITTNGTGAPLITLQVGAYAQFLSFFGLAGLTTDGGAAGGAEWTGIPDYASTMTFELFTDTNVSSGGPTSAFPAVEDIKVRFLWRNGTAGEGPPTAYPLFGQSELALSWDAFEAGMKGFAVGDQQDWCTRCGNETGVCAASSSTASNSSSSAGETGGKSSGSGGVSRPVAGVIGAVVTLAVVLGVEGLVLLLGGLTVVGKKRTATNGVAVGGGTNGKA